MHSIWSETTELSGYEKIQFEQLQEDISTHALIIGGGMAGILCAKELQQAGVDYVLVEANRIGCGITKNTTAKITAQHGLIYHKLYEKYGDEKARLYLDANMQAVKAYRKLCREMDCDYEEQDSYVYSIDDASLLERELRALDRLGVPAEYVPNLPLPFETAGAVRFSHQAQFHPLKFLLQIARGLRIYEHTRVKELIIEENPAVSATTKSNARIRKYKAMTEQAVITADKIIVATHFPFINKHGSYFLKMYQHRSYVIALEQAPKINGMYVDEAQKGMSFRSYKDMLLIGGGDHRTGKQGGNWRELADFAAKHYPDALEKFRWATQDCMTLDGIPYIGNYSAHTPDFYVVTGFNKWGMTSSMVAARFLANLFFEKEDSYAPIFSPSRSMLHPQLAINALEATVNLFTPSTKRCPHLGCALKWNSQEHSWDCPCHGSRFTESGRLIDNPATGDLQK